MFNKLDSRSPPQHLKSSHSPLDFQGSRLASLKSAIHSVLNRLLEDPMLKVLSSDHSSSQFVNSRINEIFTEIIENERESYYSSLFEKYARENLSLREEFIKALEKSELKTKELSDRLEKTENLLDFERKQNEKLGKSSADIMKKLSETSKESEELLRARESENERVVLSMRLETEELKAKILDYEEICGKMDREIDIKSQEIQRFSSNLDRYTEKIKELEENILLLRDKNKEKEQEIENYRLELEKITEFQNKRNEEYLRIIEEKEALIVSNIEKNEETLAMRLAGLEESLMRIHKEQTKKLKDKLQGKKTSFKEKIRAKEQRIQEIESEIAALRRELEENERNHEKLAQDQRVLLDRLKNQNIDLQEEFKENIRKVQREEKQKLILLEQEWDERLKKRVEDLKQEYERKVENVRVQAQQSLASNIKKTRGNESQDEESSGGLKPIKTLHRNPNMTHEKERSIVSPSNNAESLNTGQGLLCLESRALEKNLAYEDQIKTLNELNVSLKKNYDSIKAELRQTKEKSALILEERDSLEFQTVRLAKTLEDLTKARDTQIQGYQRKVEYLEEEKRKNLENVMNLSHELEEKAWDLQRLKEERRINEEKINIISSQSEKLLSSKLLLETELSRYKSEFQEKSQSFTSRISDQEELIKRKSAQITTLESELVEIKRYIQDKSEENLRFSIGKERNISDLEKNIENKRKELDERLYQLKFLESKKQDLEKALIASEHEKDTLKSKINNQKKSFFTLRKKTKAVIVGFDSLKRDNEKLKDILRRALLAKFNEVYKCFGEIQNKAKEMVERMGEKYGAQMSKCLEIERNEYLEKIRQLNEKFNEAESCLKESISLKSHEVKELRQKLNEKEEEKTELLCRLDEASRESAENQKATETRCETAEREISKSYEYIESLKEGLLKAGEKEKRSYEEFQKLKQAVSDLHSRHQKVYEEVLQNIETLKANQHDEIRHLSANYDEIIETLQSQSKKADSIRDDLKSQVHESVLQIQFLESQIAELNGESEILQGQCEGMNLENEKLRRTLARKEEEISECRRKLKDLEGLLKEKERKIMGLSQEKGAKEESLMEMKIMYDSLREERSLAEIKELRESAEEWSGELRKCDLYKSMPNKSKSPARKHQSTKGNNELLRSLNELKNLGNKIEGSYQDKSLKFAKKNRSGPSGL